MNCPVCTKQMVAKDFGMKSMVNVCEDGCKGLWFDYLGLRQVDEKNEGAGAALQAAINYPRANDGKRAPLACPKCGGIMHAHTYPRVKEVNVDECYSCGGFFLDSGELALIRDRQMSEAEEETYVHQLINAIPASHQADIVGKEDARAAAVRGLTGLIRKNYWQ
ncbi:MAG: zf-TFIIB domain-containing protein [Candidatus Omnitrophota bacterium]